VAVTKRTDLPQILIAEDHALVASGYLVKTSELVIAVRGC
jgi:hypothetical protein